MATLKDLREFQAAGAASAVAPAEVDRVWRGFAGGIYSKAQAMHALGAEPQPAASASQSSVSTPSASAVPSARTTHVVTDRAAGSSAASKEEKLAADIVGLYLRPAEAAAPTRLLSNTLMASAAADAVAADVVERYLAMKDHLES